MDTAQRRQRTLSSRSFRCALDASACPCFAANSKSQWREDRALLPILLAVTGQAAGTFVELRALDGVEFSNTFALERCLGWRGVLIEADPHNFKRLLKAPRNATRVHAAVCDDATGSIPLSVGRGAISGDVTSMTRRHAKVWGFELGGVVQLVPCKPLHTLLRAAGLAGGGADFLSLDVEGAEETVLRNALPGAFKVVMVEAAGDDPAKEERVKAILEGAGHVHTHELRFGPRMWGGWNRVFVQRALVERVNAASINATGKFPQVLPRSGEIGPSSARGARRGSSERGGGGGGSASRF